MRNLALKPISQGVYMGGIDSGLCSELNGIMVDALATSFGPSKASEGVTKLANKQKIAKIWLKMRDLVIISWL